MLIFKLLELALTVDAGSVVRTVAVAAAADGDAAVAWVATVAGVAATLCAAPHWVALGIDAARVTHHTGVQAHRVHTGLGRLTFRVRATSHCDTPAMLDTGNRQH